MSRGVGDLADTPTLVDSHSHCKAGTRATPLQSSSGTSVPSLCLLGQHNLAARVVLLTSTIRIYP